MMDDKILPCGEWLPDQPDFQNPGCSVVSNVVPRSKSTFGTVPAFVQFANTPLDTPSLGAFSAVDVGGDPGLYAGTAGDATVVPAVPARLFAATNGTKPNMVDRSAPGGYTTPVGNFWSFTEAQGSVYASNGHDPIQSVATASTDSFAPLADTNAPIAKCLAFIQPGYLLCGNIVDVTVGAQPQGIRWSALGAPGSFPLIGSQLAISNESDWQAISGPHGNLVGFAPDLASCAAAIFFEQGVFKMIFTGDAEIFDIQPVEKLRGTPAGRSIIQIGQIAYYLSHDGFYAFDGTLSVPIGADRINNFFFTDCDPNYVSNVQGCADPISGLCFWLYAGGGNTLGTPNRIIVYNTILDRWGYIEDFSGNSLFIGRSFGTSLDGIDALGYSIDTLPMSLDSPILAGGRLVLAGFDDTNTLGFFTGNNMAWSAETTEAQLIPGRRARINAVRPIVEGDIASAAVAGRQTLNDPIVYDLTNAPNNIGQCSARNEGRYQRVQMSAPAGNTTRHIKGAEVIFSPGGKR